MIRFTAVLPAHDAAEPTLVIPLDHDRRRRSRLRLMLAGKLEVGISLPRGTLLRDGDRLRSEDGAVVARVAADLESLSVARTSDLHLLARAAYHLGNRHVPLQIETGRVLYPHDHVLDGLCRELGLEVHTERLPFEPEAGGYGGGHGHGHDGHGHDGHAHDHGDGHGHEH
ncbi:MAG: urease accessory protein UreE [Myxococcota bacterium]|nr:urease accessory protein UreE [Myxococcota bacterium]